jgi:uncharacterized membrane protein YqjE
MKTSSSNSKLRGGAALLLALWALFLLSAMVISWALDINSRLAVQATQAAFWTPKPWHHRALTLHYIH